MEANLPPAGQPAVDPDVAAANKKFKIAAVIAGVLAVVAIGLAVWGFSTKSDLDTANDKLAAQSGALGSDSTKLAAAKAAYLKARAVLTKRDAQDSDLETAVTKETSDYDQAKQQTAAATTEEQKQKALAEQEQQQLEAAQACAQGTVAAINKLFDEQTADSGTSGTIDKLTKLQTQCQAAVTE
jgi:hypothetical protein